MSVLEQSHGTNGMQILSVQADGGVHLRVACRHVRGGDSSGLSAASESRGLVVIRSTAWQRRAYVAWFSLQQHRRVNQYTCAVDRSYHCLTYIHR